ncbi:MAG: 23S rRNA (uracil(1939)-C(5))-methyltransferase RlmD [Candidatus Margulisiibacteriota bacterium]|nr:23S rRNA (uracil(1939)-C(5))-methyltransferase RlmD [Candidatus Margulisiibacteriota bacterium]
MIEIKQFDDKGRGIAGDLFVKFAYPGDVIEATPLNHRKKTGKLTKLVKASPHRQEALCPHFGKCGGCSWHGLKYESQLEFKEDKVRNLFGDCSPIIPSPEKHFYRNRMDYAFGPNYTLGLRSGKFDVVNVGKCWLTSEKSNAILNRLRYFASWKKLKAHREGIIRHAVIREGINIDNAIINILTSDKGEFPLEDLWEKVQDLAQGVTWSINLSPADRSYGEIQKSFGQDYYMESLNGIKFKVPVQSFFQTNSRQAEKLLKIVKEFAGHEGGESILDLYSGTGSIGLYLADGAKKVIGVEENKAAVELSKSNAKLNGIKNYSAVSGRAEKVIKELEGKFDTIILDPPRPGVHKKVLNKIGEIKPNKIVYVSCNPNTQKHDIEILKEFGYKIKQCQPLDMFPHTPHIENIIKLQ